MKLVSELTDPLGSAVFHHFHQRNARLVRARPPASTFSLFSFRRFEVLEKKSDSDPALKVNIHLAVQTRWECGVRQWGRFIIKMVCGVRLKDVLKDRTSKALDSIEERRFEVLLTETIACPSVI